MTFDHTSKNIQQCLDISFLHIVQIFQVTFGMNEHRSVARWSKKKANCICISSTFRFSCLYFIKQTPYISVVKSGPVSLQVLFLRYPVKCLKVLTLVRPTWWKHIRTYGI